MAKPLGPKSLLIRQALTANPDKGNTELAEMLNDAEERMDDKIKVSVQDVAVQRQAIKKAGATQAGPPAEEGEKKARRKSGKKSRVESVSASGDFARPAPASATDLFAHVEAIREAVRALGADQVRRIVGLFE